MVKDFKDDSGYAFIGSANFSGTAFLNNYEDLMFTTSREVVTALHNNFETSWDYIKSDNQSLINKMKLADAVF